MNIDNLLTVVRRSSWRYFAVMTSLIATLLGLSGQVLAQREVKPPATSNTCPAAGTLWPASGRYSDPALPGHGWELQWYTPTPANLSDQARARLYFYTYTSYVGGMPLPGNPSLGFPVWYYADLLAVPDPINPSQGRIAVGNLMRVSRDSSGNESQTVVASVNFGQSADRGQLALQINNFNDVTDYGAGSFPSRSFCLSNLTGSSALGVGHEGVWRTGSPATPNFTGINLSYLSGNKAYLPTLLQFDGAGNPVWFYSTAQTANTFSPSGAYTVEYLRALPLHIDGVANSCPNNGSICLAFGHKSSLSVSVPQAPGVRPGTATMTSDMTFDALSNPSECQGFARNAQGQAMPLTPIQPIICRALNAVSAIGPISIHQNTALADLAPITPCQVTVGQPSCTQEIVWSMRRGSGDQYLLIVNQTNQQILHSRLLPGAGIDNETLYSAGTTYVSLNAGSRVKAVLATATAASAAVGQNASTSNDGLRLFKSSAEFIIAIPAPAVPTVSAQLQAGTNTVNLSWNSVPSATQYGWRRVVAASGAAGSDTTVTSTSASDTPADGTYRYEVRACHSAGCSAYGSSPVVAVGNTGTFDEWTNIIPQAPTAASTLSIPSFADGALEVGATSGSFRVDESGQATYSLPIATAAATGGMAPEVSINYSSAAQDSHLGMGFQISGLSSIARCRKTVATDELSSPIGVVINYTDDEFCLDGQRLVYQRSGSDSLGNYLEYSTELQSFARIRSYQQPGITGPAYWASYGKDGILSLYGLDGATGVACQKNCSGRIYRNENGAVRTDAVSTWLISKVRSRNALKTTMEFEYSFDQANGEARISKIWYSGADTGAQTLSAYLQFDYNAPSNIGRTRPRVQFAAGARSTVSAYLSAIGSFNEEGVKVRGYRFTYMPINSSGQATNPFARLQSIQECAGNDSSCLAPVTFNWSENLPKVFPGATQAGLNFDDARDKKFGDINGDGRTDAVFSIGDNNQEIVIGFSSIVGGVNRFTRVNTGLYLLRRFDNDRAWHLLDYNQDGRDDLLIAQSQPGTNGNWKIYLSQGTGFSTVAVVPFAPMVVPYGNNDWTTDSQVADYTGDGLPDLIAPMSSISGDIRYQLFAMRRATASRACDSLDVVAGQSQSVAQVCPYEFAPPIPVIRTNANILGGQFYKNDSENYESIDVNGDGAADMMMRFSASCSVASLMSRAPAAELKFLTDPAQSSAPSIGLEDDTRSSDCWYWGVFENRNPSSTAVTMQLVKAWRTSATNEPDETPGALQLTDLNADGLADAIYRSKGGEKDWYYELNTGLGFAPPQCVFVNPNTQTCSGIDNSADTGQLLDFDGDGDQDFLVGLESGGTQTNCPGGSDGTQPYAVLRFDGDRFVSNFLCPNQVGHYRGSDASVHMFIDLDGDGAIDSVNMSQDGQGNYALSTRSNRFSAADRIVQITNGTGSRTLIDYAPMNFSSVYRRDYSGAGMQSGPSPVFDMLSPQFVVNRVQSSAPTRVSPSNLSSVRYFYAGSKSQSGGRGSLGMRFVGSIDEQTNVQTWSEYAQNFPYIGRPVRTVSKRLNTAPADACAAGGSSASCMVRATVCVDSSGRATRDLVCDPFSVREGQLLSESTQTYTIRDPAWGGVVQGKDYRVFPAVKQEFSYEWNTETGTSTLVKMATIAERYSYDGNLYESNSAICAPRPNVSRGLQPGPGPTVICDPIETVRSAMSYTSINALNADWVTGLLSESTTITEREGNSVSRYARFAYFDDGSLKTEEMGSYKEPGTFNPLLKTHYVRNGAAQVTLKASCSANYSYEQCTSNNGTHPINVERVPSDPQSIRRAESYVYDAALRFVDKTYVGYSDGSSYLSYKISQDIQARDALSNPTQVRNVNNILTRTAYSPLGRKYFETTDGTGASMVTQTRWCAGSIGAQLGASPIENTCPTGAQYVEIKQARGGNTGWTYFDVLGRDFLNANIGFIANGESIAPTSRVVHVSKTYDALARVIEVSEPYYASLGSFQSCGIGASGVPCTKTDFDFAGRSIRVTLPDGTATTTSYKTAACISGGGTCSLRSVINAKLQETTELRDALGQVRQIRDAQGMTLTHSYDAQGNAVSTTRSANNADIGSVIITNSATFDQFGRRTSVTDPDAGTSISTYNPAGEVLTDTNANGFCVKSVYDALGRVVTRSDHRSSDCASAIESTSSFVYDTAANGLGLPHSETNGNTTRTMFYDSISRAKRIETIIDGESFAQESTFDEYGRKFQDFDLVFDAGTANAINAGTARKVGAQYDYNAQGYQTRIRNAAGVASDIYYEVLSMNARGQVTRSKRGNHASMVTDVVWDAAMGRLMSKATGALGGNGNDGALQNLSYDDANGNGYDDLGNLLYRQDVRRGLRESFSYDSMNRLTGSTLTLNGQSSGTQSFSYDQLGNFLLKNNERQRTGGYQAIVGLNAVNQSCARQSVGPHMLTAIFKNGVQDSAYCYDAAGNQISASGSTTRSISYAVHNKPLEISVTGPNASHTRYRYGPNREITTRHDGANSSSLTTLVRYVGGVEVYQHPDQGSESNRREFKRSVGGFMLINLRTHTLAGQTVRTSDRRYVFKEKLGSTDVITDAIGAVVSGGQMSFDAWGERRAASNWLGMSALQIAGFDSRQTRKGYTGHEMVDGANLIHMGGRLYDPHTGRFLSADPIVQAPNNTQSFNRYAYVMNNPMNYTDPTGYSWLSDNWRTIASIAITAFAPYAWGAIGSTLTSMTQAVITGMVSGAVQSGSLKGALMGGFSAGMFHGIGDVFADVAKASEKGAGLLAEAGKLNSLGVAAKIGAHAAAGGVMSVLQGGKFGHGFVSAGIVEGVGPKALAMAGDNKAAQIIGAAVIGGTASKLAGGKFANGAASGAFQWAFNQLSHSIENAMTPGPDWQGSSRGDRINHNGGFEGEAPYEAPLFESGMEGGDVEYQPGNGAAPYDYDVYVTGDRGQARKGPYRGSISPDAVNRVACQTGGCSSVADGSYSFFADNGIYSAEAANRYLMLRIGNAPRRDGAGTMTGVWVHKGYNNGTNAEGCLTVHKDNWAAFIGNFQKGSKGQVRVLP
jgi:RHS repeat-associated protein